MKVYVVCSSGDGSLESDKAFVSLDDAKEEKQRVEDEMRAIMNGKEPRERVIAELELIGPATASSS